MTTKHERYEQTIRSALLRLSKKIGPEVLDIPVTVVSYKETGIEVAATDASSIMVSSKLLKRDPLNLEVYLAHEIFHDVIHDDQLVHEFDSSVLNEAEDYLINSYLLELYGYDVLNVVFPGLYAKKYTGWPLLKIAKAIQKTGVINDHYFSNSHKHPTILKVANILRKQLGLDTVKSILETELDDTFSKELKKAYDTFNFSNLPNVNPEVAISSIWTLFHSQNIKWKPENLGKYLTQTEAILLGPAIDNEETLDDPEFALFCTRHLLATFNDSESLVKKKIWAAQCKLNRVVTRIYCLDEDLQSIRSRKERDVVKAKLGKLAARMPALKAKLAYLSSLPSLKTLLLQPTGIPVRVSKRSISLRSTLSSARLTSEYPKFSRRAPLIVLLRALQKLAGSPKAIKELYEQFAGFAKDFADEEEEENTEEHGEDAEDSNVTGKQAGPNGDKSSPRLQALETLAANPKVFKSILRNALEFGEKLISKSTSSVSESGLIDRTLSFGNDLSRTPASELGRLGNMYTQLSFLVDLANSNLLQYADTDPRRSPLILELDCSGSMTGKRYELAAGFCFSLIRKMQTSNRGCALIKFTDEVDEVFVWDGNKVSLATLLKALSTPSLQGTDFDTALTEAFSVHRRQGWVRSQVLLITDGYGSISPSVQALKPSGCKVTAILVNNRYLAGVDECINVARNNLTIELVRVGNRFL